MEKSQQQNPLYTTVNKGYGEHWQSSEGKNPIAVDGVPVYKDLGDRDLALKHSQKTYKHEVLKEMREKGELDTQVYGKIKSDMNSVKMQDVIPRDFPVKSDQINYPQHALNTGNLLYRTSNMNYGV